LINFADEWIIQIFGMNLNPKIKARLSALTQGNDGYGFEYNGVGDRLSQTVNEMTTNYTLDLNSGLTQVLNDGNYDYLRRLPERSVGSVVRNASPRR